MIYLASPYTHEDPVVVRQRFDAVCRAAAVIMGQGVRIFSPIAHTHPIAESGALPLGWDYWEQYDREMIGFCDEFWVLMLDGWDNSRGVRAEARIAHEFGKPAYFVDPENPYALGNRRPDLEAELMKEREM